MYSSKVPNGFKNCKRCIKYKFYGKINFVNPRIIQEQDQSKFAGVSILKCRKIYSGARIVVYNDVCKGTSIAWKSLE